MHILENGYEIRNLNKEEHFKQVYELCLKCSDYFILHDGIGPDEADGREVFDSLPPDNTYDDKFILGVFGLNKELAGLAEIVKDYPVRNSWIIGLMFIEPDLRKQGIGRLLHGEIENLARSSGADTLRLGAVEENADGVRFWKSLGYGIIRQEKRDYKRKTHTLYVMTLKLH